MKDHSPAVKELPHIKGLYAEQTLVRAVYDPPALQQLIKAVRGKPWKSSLSSRGALVF